MTQHQKILGDKVALSEEDFALLERKARAVDWVQEVKALIICQNFNRADEFWVVDWRRTPNAEAVRGPTWLDAAELAMKASEKETG